MACSGCARRRAKIKAAYNKYFDKQPPGKVTTVSAVGGKKFTTFEKQATPDAR